MSKGKLVTEKTVLIAQKALHDAYAGGELDDSQVQLVLEAVAPHIAARGLKRFARFFENEGPELGIKLSVSMQIGFIARAFAREIRKGTK
jgi:predicted aconitase